MKNQFINIDLMPEYIAKPSFINFQLLFSIATLGIIGFFFVYLPIINSQNELISLQGEYDFLYEENQELNSYLDVYINSQEYDAYSEIVDEINLLGIDLNDRIGNIEDKLGFGSNITRIDFSYPGGTFVINIKFSSETDFFNFYWSLYDIPWVDTIKYESLNINPVDGSLSTKVTITFEVEGDTND